MKLSDKEILFQLALGTFDGSQMAELINETKNPEILTAAAKFYAKLSAGKNFPISNGSDADNITTTFMNNDYTPQLVKSYIMLSRQLKNIEKKEEEYKKLSRLTGPIAFTYHPPEAGKRLIVQKIKKIHEQLFGD